jgi:hypothetical protein
MNGLVSSFIYVLKVCFPREMPGSYLCVPRNEIVQPHYFKNIIKMFCLPIPFLHSYICERFIYFQDRSVYFSAAKYVDRSWEYINCSQTHERRNCGWGCAIPFLGIHKLDFRHSVELYTSGHWDGIKQCWIWATYKDHCSLDYILYCIFSLCMCLGWLLCTLRSPVNRGIHTDYSQLIHGCLRGTEHR